MKYEKPTFKSAVICGHTVLPIPCRTEEELCRWLLSMKNKHKTILYVKQNDDNKKLFKDILSILSLRHSSKKRRDYLKSGDFGIACTHDGNTYIFIGGDENGRYEHLDVIF